MMKKLNSKITILLVSILFIFQNCKKGSEDPSISFITRKARMEGSWSLRKGNAGLTLLNPASPPFAQSFVLDGSHAIATETSNGPPTVYSFAYILSLDIKKDGTFTMTENYGNSTLSANGKWNFLSGIGELKNKEAVIFIIESVENGETTGHLFNKQSTEFTYKIIGLRSKELKIETGSKEYINANGKSVSYSGTYEFTQ